MSRKRRQDIWNENAEALGELRENNAEEFIRNTAQNSEGISADREKYIFDETTTPKLFPPNKRN